MSRWMYLSDLCPKATIINLDTGDLREIMSGAVTRRAPIGLRRYLLEESSAGIFEETGEFLPVTQSIADDLIEYHRNPNGWNYDWVHLPTEQLGDDPAAAARIAERLTAMMAGHPYEFQITGLQRRFLWYYSDGSHETQQRFEALLPAPDRYPYRSDGTLHRRFNWIWNSIMRDAGVPYPTDKRSEYGGLRPMLYRGPAWTVRFLLDGQDVLLERCRVYVDDDANFICSDWCQRHDFSSYDNGINLQTGLYTFDGWVTGPCIIRNQEGGKFKPKQVTVKREAVRDLMKRAPLAVSPVKFEDAFVAAKANVAKYSKPLGVAPVIDAGPITPEIMAEAFSLAAPIIDAAVNKAADELAAATPTTRTPEPEGVPEPDLILQLSDAALASVVAEYADSLELPGMPSDDDLPFKPFK